MKTLVGRVNTLADAMVLENEAARWGIETFCSRNMSRWGQGCWGARLCTANGDEGLTAVPGAMLAGDLGASYPLIG
ncbi:hypothetical protein GALL_104040 [mine drainage metagenome]|uniref:Uncharacterized protein n=1 Tax=mine drainage metagenome TaxID=410659 RepID=A0A1J5STV2_9ZZZZ